MVSAMTFFVLDRIGFLKPGDYNFHELPSGAVEAKEWLKVNQNWRFHIEDSKTRKLLEEFVGEKPLPIKRKHGALPVLGLEDLALIIYRDPAPNTTPQIPGAPARVKQWYFGVLTGHNR